MFTNEISVFSQDFEVTIDCSIQQMPSQLYENWNLYELVCTITVDGEPFEFHNGAFPAPDYITIESIRDLYKTLYDNTGDSLDSNIPEEIAQHVADEVREVFIYAVDLLTEAHDKILLNKNKKL